MKCRTVLATVTVTMAGALAAAACGSSVSAEIDRDRQLDADMAAVVASGVPGVALVIRDEGNTTRLAQGLGDVATGTPMGVDDRIRIGSLSKSYVAVVVLQLVDEGRLALDDRIEQWVPGLVPNGADISVRQLLNHTSGIPNYEEHPDYMAPYLAGDFGHVTTPRQLVHMGTSQGELFPPGTSSAYSNTNYTVAGLVVEAATGRPLAEELERRIFDPLDLDATYLPEAPEIDGVHAHGYFVMGQPPATDVTRFSPSIGWAGGGIVSTDADVTTFYRALLGGELLPAHLLEQMMTTVTGSSGERYGLGLAQRELSCGTAWGHGGNFPGYLVESYSSPTGGHQVTAAYNLDPNSMAPASKEAVTSLLEHAFCGVDG